MSLVNLLQSPMSISLKNPVPVSRSITKPSILQLEWKTTLLSYVLDPTLLSVPFPTSTRGPQFYTFPFFILSVSEPP